MTDHLALRAADNIRILTAAMVEKAKSGHPGGAMGGADFIQILYSEFLRFDPGDMNWPFRDRFFLDPGHMSPMLYSILAMFGIYTIDDLKGFRQWQSCTPGHPELNVEKGIENTSGPLGQGHAMAVGAAIAERFIAQRFGEWTEHKIFTFISDGGIQEEVSQGVGRIAGYLGLHNLIMFFDSNDIQLSTKVDEVTFEDTGAKYRAWGWHVMTIDGHDHNQIRMALTNAIAEKDRPTLIIGKTIMGKGALTAEGNLFERQVSTHGQPLTAAGASFEKTILNLGGDPVDPFRIFPDVEKEYRKIIELKKKESSLRKAEQRKWESANPLLAEKLNQFLSGHMPALDFDEIVLKKDQATRSASGTVLEYLGKKVENMIVISADLSNSDKTEGFIKGGKKPFGRHDFTGGFLHAGVSELSMAAIANGIALHSGIFVACGTFFVFSDFMKPAIRMAALMRLPVKYIFTHDAFRVGEDGPTHQPVEQEAQLRLMEHLKNHKGQNSMLVLRPADGWETVKAWEMAMKNELTPTALILSRQNVADLPDQHGIPRKSQAKEAEKGAYVVYKPDKEPDVILIANGSEVSTLMAATLKLMEKKITPQVVSVISEGLFLRQDVAYQKTVLPPGKLIFGLTAGLTYSLRCLIGTQGTVFGLNHFGYSAPAGVLDEKFGFTPEQVFQKIIEYLNK